MPNSIAKVTAFVHYVLKERINKGNTVVDATMGNGNDTLFLAKLVGLEGKVFAFDIQAVALSRTMKKIKDNKLTGYNISLINDSHEAIENYVTNNVDAAMFNLGYLPQGDHSIITRPSSTIKCIESVLKLLSPKGIISIVIYYGHKGGMEEKQEVLGLLETLSSKDFNVMKCSYPNKDNNPPIIVFIEKK